MINNIFNYATSELSQDAFLCWLLSYAKKDAKEDKGLRDCAINFIKDIIPSLTNSKGDIFVSDIERQYNNIDVLFTVNDNYVVIIENKTFSSEHSNQLVRYTDIITTDPKFGKYELFKVLYKTGFQSNISFIEEAGFKFIGLEQIMKLFAPYVSRTENQIFQDYYSYWDNFNKTVMEYTELPVNKWGWQHINGFYRDFKKSGIIGKAGFDTDFDYVANPRGGLYAMWMSNDSFLYYNEQKYELYLQLEFSEGKFQLCLRTGIKQEEGIDTDVTPGDLRNFLTYYISESGKWIYTLSEYGFVKPDRFGTGATMTIGVIPLNEKTWIEVKNCVSDVINKFPQIINSINARKTKGSS